MQESEDMVDVGKDLVVDRSALLSALTGKDGVSRAMAATTMTSAKDNSTATKIALP